MGFRRCAFVFLTLAVISTGCGSTQEGASGAANASPALAAQNAAEAALLPTDALALPDLDLAGYEELLAELDGTPLVVNFWGSWCGPCREEAPNLAAAHRRYGDRVQFLGVDILDARGSAREFIREFGWTYPSVFDVPGAIRDGLGLLGQPVTLLYDARGELVHRWIGPVPPAELTAELERIAAA